MAVYTKLSEENLKDILSNYNLGKLDTLKVLKKVLKIQITFYQLIKKNTFSQFMKKE